MRFRGTHEAARVPGLAGLSGTNAGAVYGQYAAKVKEVFSQPYPAVTGTRPPDALIFSDKYAYLRQVLNNADWGGVSRWYATQIQQAVDYNGWYDPLNPPAPAPPPPPPAPTSYIPEPAPVAVAPPPPVIVPRPIMTDRRPVGGKNARLQGLGDLAGLNPKEYWNLSKLNLQDYCDRTFNLSDLHAFTKEGILKLCIADYGNKVGFGYQGPMDYLNLALFFANGLSHNSGQLDWEQSYKACKGGYRYGMCVGWVKEPSKHTASNIIVAIGAAFMGAAAWQAISAGGGAVAGGATGGGATGGTAGGAVVGTGAGAVGTGIETVVVTASAAAPITAGTVAAGLAAGTLAASAAAPAITAATPPIETVVVQAAPVSTVSAGTVAAGVAAGTVAAVAAAPPIVAPSTPIETVTVEASAQQPVTAGTVGAGLATGAVVATTAPPITSGTIETVTVEAPAESIQIDPVEAAITGVTSIAITQPTINVPEPNLPEIDTEQTLTDRVVEGLENAIADLGADAVIGQLEQWLENLLGRPPTPTEVDQWEDWINNGGTTPPPTVSEDSLLSKSAPWILAAVLAYAVYEYTREPSPKRKR